MERNNGTQSANGKALVRLGVMDSLFGAPVDTPLEDRIFNAITFLGALTGYVTIMTNYLFHLPAAQQIASVGLAVSSSIMYYFGRVLKKRQVVALPVLLFILAITTVNWFVSEGIEGATGYYFSILCIGGLILLGEKFHSWPLWTVLFVIGGLTVITAVQPSLITPYATPVQKRSDILIGLIISLFINGLMVYLVFKEFLRERAAKDSLLKEVLREKETVEAALRDKQRLYSIVCHDIANALFVIKNSVDLEKKKAKLAGENGRSHIHLADFAVGNITEIIDSVRMMDAVAMGKITFVLAPVEVSEVIEKARILFRDRLKEKNLALQVMPVDIPQVRVLAEAKTLANNVFNNVLSNAIKFSYPGAAIHVNVANHGSETAISIRDTGMGIPVDLRRDLFNPGAKTSRPGTGGEKGTGFGMLVINTFMKLYGGRVEVESRCMEENSREHGTTVTLFLRSHA